tara:strand:- start:248 stop:808 length:561 start_codon:yes stop_codon:yes gene_type:complete
MEIKETGILIISGPRCGSTNLMKSLASSYDKNFSFEPDLINHYPKFSSNDVVKIIPFWETHLTNPNTFRYNLLLENIKQFKNIILLKRKNIVEQIESYYVMKKYNTGKIDRKWNNEKITKDSSYTFFEKYINETNKVIDDISIDLDLEISYYEDIFKEKKLKNYKLDLSFLDYSNKLKQINKERLV